MGFTKTGCGVCGCYLTGLGVTGIPGQIFRASCPGAGNRLLAPSDATSKTNFACFRPTAATVTCLCSAHGLCIRASSDRLSGSELPRVECQTRTRTCGQGLGQDRELPVPVGSRLPTRLQNDPSVLLHVYLWPRPLLQCAPAVRWGSPRSGCVERHERYTGATLFVFPCLSKRLSHKPFFAPWLLRPG